MVAFCADKEDWMTAKLYKEAKGLFLSGRIHMPKGTKASEGLYEVRWTVTNHQTKQYFHQIGREKVEEGVRNYATLSGGILNNASWRHICQVPDSEAWEDGNNLDDYVILDGSTDVFVSEHTQPENLEEVEKITNLDFQPGRQMQEPSDLFKHAGGSIETKLIKEHRRRFETASSGFIAYLPLSFWRAVVSESNKYAGMPSKPITLDEMMRLFGILFYMTIVDKGEYSNYWGVQAEDEIFGVPSSGSGLDAVMTLKRFKFIRTNLCFRCDIDQEDLKKDPAARIRPLINMLKTTSLKYVSLGRNIAVDESSIACRSKFARHLIVFNSSKPTGKYHFKIYACCCATTWLMVNFRLHCSSDIRSRLSKVTGREESADLENRLQFSSSVRQIVLEVTQPLHGSRRVVNSDNWYTSVTLLLSLRDVGLYGRGTIRENSAHFPKAHMFSKKSDEPRGSSLQGVSTTGEMIVASWRDGSTVNILSNADSSGMGEVTRLVGQERKVFPAPKCVSENNKHMQGVDCLHQLRAKYSIADGHSMQKWHKKLALAFIDIARVNAYVTKGLRGNAHKKTGRNQHQQFMIDLASELISGRWKDSVEDDGSLLVDDHLSTTSKSPTSSPSVPACDFVLSSKQFPDATRGKRGCKVCAFEGRRWTMKSIYCTKHNVCLCTNSYPLTEALADVVCPNVGWNSWQKYHAYYLPRGVFNENGKIKRSSTIFKACRQLKLDRGDQATLTRRVEPSTRVLSPDVDAYSPQATNHFMGLSPLPNASNSPNNLPGVRRTLGRDVSAAPESPPTLVFSPFDGAAHDGEESRSPRGELSPAHENTSEREPTGGFRTHFEEYLSPREVQSTPASSTDFAGSLVLEL